MRKLALLCLVSAVAMATTYGNAMAFEGGGRSPSTAPLIEWGPQYAGQLNNHRDDANFTVSDYDTVAFYRLPPVSTHDVVTVNWHALPRTLGSGFPVCLALVQGVDDYSWGSTFERATYGYCSSHTGVYTLTGSGTARSEITVQQTDSTATYLEFFATAGQTEPAYLETYPYDFSVESPRHALTLSLASVSTVPSNGQLHASVTGATGQPAPDGLTYTLTATWERGGLWTGTATSSGGQLGFQLSLPEAAQNEYVRFIVSRAADSQYQAVESTSFRAKVTAPYVPPPPGPSKACKKATSLVQSLARQRHRLQSNLHRARGRTKRRLRNKVGHVTRAWHAAQTAETAACS
jgi:hypothetical protein